MYTGIGRLLTVKCVGMMNPIIVRCAWNRFEAMGVSTQLAWVTLGVNPSIIMIEALKVFRK
jgi:hypothetical protein